MRAILQDLRQAAGRLGKTPILAAVVAMSLGLAIGANSAIFTLLDALYFRPPPVADADRLVRIYSSTADSARDRVSYPDFENYRDQVGSFAGLIASGRRGGLLQEDNAAEQLIIEVVSRDYFDFLQIAPERGALWDPDSSDPATNQRIVISHDLWQRRFAGDPAIVGRSLRLNGRQLVVGAVMPPSFSGLDRLIASDVWISFDAWASQIGSASEFSPRGLRWLDVWGRLSPSSTIEQARAQAAVVATRLARQYPETNQDRSSSVVLEVEQRRQAGAPLSLLLWTLAGLVLAVCCANIANLLLAQFEGRTREIATRSALGASRLRIVRQVMAEALLLALAGGALGLVLATWVADLLPAVMPPTSVRLNLDFGVDGRVAAFTLAIAALATILFSSAPATHAAGTSPVLALRASRNLGAGRLTRLNVRNLLVVGQMAACFVLLTASGLLNRSLLNTVQTDLGFERKQMLLVELNPGLAGYSRDAAATFFNEWTQGLQALPGVNRVSYAARAPLSGSGGGANVSVFSATRNIGDPDAGLAVKYNVVGTDYFPTMGTRILRGRGFDARDRSGSQPVVLISETMARRFWGDDDPIGETIRAYDADWEIVGVAHDVKINRIHEPPEPYLYFAFAQRPRSEITVLIETESDAAALAAPVRSTLGALAPDVPVTALQTQQELLQYAQHDDRFYAALASALAALGLFLAAVGLFGVISYLVRLRTNEIGVRMALGAQPREVLVSFLKTGMLLSFSGVLLGAPLCFAAARFLYGFLHGVSPTDPASYLIAAAVVTATAACAAFLPARAAVRIDPLQALRYE